MSICKQALADYDGGNNGLAWRWYRQEALEAFVSSREREVSSGVFAMPMGSGKSVTIADIVVWLLRHTDQSVLVLAHRSKLIEQNTAELYKAVDYKAAVCSAGLGKHEIGRVTYATEKTIINTLRKSESRITFDVVIIDECQYVPETQESVYGQILRWVKPKHLYGMSATPFRDDVGLVVSGKDEDARFKKIIYDLSTGSQYLRLVSDGYLAPIKQIKSDSVDGLDDLKLNANGDDYTAMSASRVFGDPVNVKLICDTTSRFINDNDIKSTAIYCPTICTAELYAKELMARGLTVGLYHSKLAGGLKDAVLDRFKAGRFQVMINVDILTVGFNMPRLQLIVLARKFASLGLYRQTLGRVGRSCEGKDCGMVLDFGDNIASLGPINGPLPSRKSETAESDAPTKICPKCGNVIHVSALQCPECGHDYRKVKDREFVGLSDGEVIDYGKKHGYRIVESVSAISHTTQAGESCVKVDIKVEGRQKPFSVYIKCGTACVDSKNLAISKKTLAELFGSKPSSLSDHQSAWLSGKLAYSNRKLSEMIAVWIRSGKIKPHSIKTKKGSNFVSSIYSNQDQLILAIGKTHKDETKKNRRQESE